MFLSKNKNMGGDSMRDIENKFSLVDAGDIAKPAADVTVKVLSILEKAGFVFESNEDGDAITYVYNKS